MNTRMRARKRIVSALTICIFGFSHAALGAATYVSGHITDFTYYEDGVMIQIDAGIPDNCAGTPGGWMKVPAEHKPMMAFLLALWSRGDAAQTTVAVYTSGWDGSF